MKNDEEIKFDERKKLSSPHISYQTINPSNDRIDIEIESPRSRGSIDLGDLMQPNTNLTKKEFVLRYIKPNIGMMFFILASIAMILVFYFVAKWQLDWKGWYTVSLIFAVLTLLLRNITEPEHILLAALVSLVITKIITPAQALSGFGNDAIVTIGILFVVSKGIENTNAFEILLRNVLGNPKSISVAILRMMIPVAICSAFMNNSPVVAMMIPVIQSWARRNKLNDRKLLMPLSWASILGGTCTLIGSSTNLIVYGFAQLDDPNLVLNIFEIGMAGAPLVVIGIIYVLIFHRLLKGENGDIDNNFKMEEKREYIISAKLSSNRFTKKNLVDSGLWNIGGLKLYSVEIGGKIEKPSEEMKLNFDDILNYQGIVKNFPELIGCDGLELIEERKFKYLKKNGAPILVEVVISANSELIGKKPSSKNFILNYNAVVISVFRSGSTLEGKMSEIEIEKGDCLVLRTTTEFVSQYKYDARFLSVSKVQEIEIPLKDKKKMIASLLIVVAMIVVTSTGYVSLLGTSLVAALLMLAIGCLTPEQAWKATRGNLLMIIAAAFSLGVAMDETGTAKEIARTLVDVFKSIGDVGILFGLYYATSILTSVISNGATVSVMYPIAYELTMSTELKLKQVIYVLMFAGSACFSTPFGYQTNLMVMGPGRYSFMDFVKFGLPMQIILGVPSVLLCYYIYK